MTVRSADQLIQASLADTLAALDLTAKDAAAARLAAEYAQAIDLCCGNPDVLDKLGPKLLAVLDALGATPAARAKIKGGKPGDAKPDRLAELRAAANR